MIFYDIVGWIGAIMVLIAYILLSLNILKNGILYQFLNFVSSVLMAIGLYPKNSWFAFVLQVAWGVISLIALIDIWQKSHSKKPHKPKELNKIKNAKET